MGTPDLPDTPAGASDVVAAPSTSTTDSVGRDGDPASNSAGLASHSTDIGTRSVPSTIDKAWNFRDIESKPVEWLWPGWVPLGKIIVLGGQADVGKSTLLLDLAARVSATGLMPDSTQGSAGNVVIMSAQDGA